MDDDSAPIIPGPGYTGEALPESESESETAPPRCPPAVEIGGTPEYETGETMDLKPGDEITVDMQTIVEGADVIVVLSQGAKELCRYRWKFAGKYVCGMQKVQGVNRVVIAPPRMSKLRMKL